MNNVAFLESETANALIRDRGAWVLFLLPYSQDLNPIETAHSKLKTPLRKQIALNFDTIWQAIEQICELFTPGECQNYFKAAAYEARAF